MAEVLTVMQMVAIRHGYAGGPLLIAARWSRWSPSLRFRGREKKMAASLPLSPQRKMKALAAPWAAKGREAPGFEQSRSLPFRASANLARPRENHCRALNDTRSMLRGLSASTKPAAIHCRCRWVAAYLARTACRRAIPIRAHQVNRSPRFGRARRRFILSGPTGGGGGGRVPVDHPGARSLSLGRIEGRPTAAATTDLKDSSPRRWPGAGLGPRGRAGPSIGAS